MRIRKRDGSLQSFDSRKIVRAMLGAFNEVQPGSIPDLRGLTAQVATRLNGNIVDIETIQDVVEQVLMPEYPAVAKAFIIYRQKRAEARKARATLHADPKMLADYIHPAKYAKWLPAQKRRETYIETSHRSRDMHLQRFPALANAIQHYWQWVDEQMVLPSMRSMQFGGPAILAHNARMFNCSFTLLDRIRAFSESFYLLLCGCGVGYSVQWQHVNKIPPLSRINRTVRHYVIQDTIEGWADSVLTLLDSYMTGYHVELSYANIRPEGSPLRTSGGKAPGHLPLRRLHESMRRILDYAQGRQLRPIECHDIQCHIAEAVLAGGIRRSSLISLFSMDDGEMLYSKTPENFQFGRLNPQREMANNSVVLLRSSTSEAQFRRVMSLNRQTHGEPGFFFTNHLDYGCNPCGEIGMYPVYNEQTGFSFCNLCEINVAALKNEREFLESAEAASFIGTLQAAYTDFPYLGTVSTQIAQRDGLLGVGLTGIMDNPELGFNDQLLQKAAGRVRLINRSFAPTLGLRPAKRATCVKPSGTASLELGCSSGIHPRHARRYFRRVTANPLEPVAQYFRKHNPHMVEVKPNGDWCLTFCVEPPVNAITVKNMSANDFVDAVLKVYKAWVLEGGDGGDLTHNVSNTITFRPEEWEDLLSRVWQSRDSIAAMSFAPIFTDKGVPFCPQEEVVTEQDEAKWRYLLEHAVPVDYSAMVEEQDMTAVAMEVACSGGKCELAPGSVATPATGITLISGHNMTVVRGGLQYQLSASDVKVGDELMDGCVVVARPAQSAAGEWLVAIRRM